MKHNVYDFDKTIYKGDATIDFYLFCLRKNPSILLEMPITITYLILYILGIKSKTEYKEKYFRFLRHLKSIEDLVDEFWIKKSSRIESFYKKLHKENDIIISASPEFILKPICNDLNVKYLIGSRIDKNTGQFDGENCKGQEKLKRFKEQMAKSMIGEFYSDSYSDAPLANISEKPYMVKNGKIFPWNDYNPSIIEKISRIYLGKEFLLFIFCGGVGTLTNFTFALIISTKVNSTLSYVCGYIISLLVTYALNASLIFKEKYKIDHFMKFVISYIPNFTILFVFVLIFLNIFNWNNALVYALAGLLGIPVTYLLVKILVFKKEKE